MAGPAGKMTEKKIPGFNGTVMIDETTPPRRTRPSLFPTREQVASLAGLPLPQPRATAHPPQVVSDVDATELNDFEMADAPSPLESAPVYSNNEPSLSHATPAPQHSSSFRTPTVPRPEGYTTPPRGPSFSPITPPAQLAAENDDAGKDISSLESPAPLVAINPPESAVRSSLFRTTAIPLPRSFNNSPHGLSSSPIAPPTQPSAENSGIGQDILSLELPSLVAAINPPESAVRSTLVRTSTGPLPEGYETLPHELSRLPIARPAQPSAENNNASHNLSLDEPAVSAAMCEPTAPQATPNQHANESNNEEDSVYEIWGDALAPQPQPLAPQPNPPINVRTPGDTHLLNMPDNIMNRILDLLLVYDEPIALVRKRSDRRIVEADKSHILTVGKGKITRERQNKKMMSKVARSINTASPTNLFLVCRALRNLGIKTYYNKNTFAFSKEQGLAGWAASIGSRQNEVRKVELRSEWDLVFMNNDIHSEYLRMDAGKGVLHTTELRVFGNIERVNIDIALRMPWQRTGKLPDYDKVSLDAQKRCFKLGKQIAWDKALKFMIRELNTELIAKHLHIWFDKTWEEDRYESAEFKRRDAEYKRERAALRAAKISSGKDS